MDRETGAIAGLLDMNDLCCYVASLYDDFTPGPGEVKSFDYLFERSMRNKKVEDLMNFSGANYCYPLRSNDTFRSVLECLAKKGCHRVPMLMSIEKEKGKGLTRFVTQSQVVQFIATNLQVFGSVLDKTVLQSGLGTGGAVSLKTSDTTIDALRLLAKTHVTGFPIVDEHGKLVNVFSARDLRYFAATTYADKVLTLPIEEFLDKVRTDYKYMAPRTVAICGLMDTLRTVITKMNGLRIHRLFVVSPKDEPIGVVTLTDIIAFLVSHDHLWDEHKMAVENAQRATKEFEKELAKEHKQHAVEAKHIQKVVKETLKEGDD
jgi:CBS domain-containing protein